MKEIIKNCDFCGQEFMTTDSRKKYCTAKCRDKMGISKKSSRRRVARIKAAAKNRCKETNLAGTNQTARELHLTYGQYKAMQYMQKLEGVKL